MLQERLKTIWKIAEAKFCLSRIIGQTLALFDFHLFRWKQNASKPVQFFLNGIHKLPERMENMSTTLNSTIVQGFLK